MKPDTRQKSRSTKPDTDKSAIQSAFRPSNRVTLHPGDCLELLRSMPDACADLVVTSPPYNIGKEYEKKLDLEQYVAQQQMVIHECIRALSRHGSICWQVGNFVENGAIIPLDTILYPIFADAGLKLRNRIIWHFEHGLHCAKRLSGRYEVIVWFTKTGDYIFNLDPIRVPQKYPGKKHFKGPKAGQYSCNPKGKNPGDIWAIPNVKNNHIEKTEHPCQFPVELIERLVLALTHEGGLVVDPFMGTGTTAIAAIRHQRRAAGAEIEKKYLNIARQRIALELNGELPTRPMNKPIHQPSGNEKISQSPFSL
ncbi:site-specific DNA-methyltransferase [Candidatus Sumerlaeota bacterium]|nr:site-specific DNA-methyltransferase [Candidatus Sumerlaeota bacterium]